MKHLLLAASLALCLGGCANERQAVADVISSQTTSSPAQAKTLAEAIQMTTVVEYSLDLVVQSGVTPPAVIDELKILVPVVHNALKKAEAAQAAGNSPLVAASLTAFNEAFAALAAYKAQKGVS